MRFVRLGHMGRRVPAALCLGLLVAILLPAAVAAGDGNSPGAVFVMTNDPTGNDVMVYPRRSDGTLGSPTSFPTGGNGSAQFEQSGNALILTGVSREASPNNFNGDHRFVIATNSNSNSISVFRVRPDGLELATVQHSGGSHPISVTVSRGRLFVLNGGNAQCMGGVSNIAGFTLDAQGDLEPIAGATRPLGGGPSSGCSQLSFNPQGDVLVASERASDTITTYTIGADGLPSAPITNQTSGNGPFAFTFTQTGTLVTSENFQGAPGQGGAASYEIRDDGTLVPLGSERNFRSDTCWAVVTDSGKYAYTSNAMTGDVSSYTVNRDGTLTLLQSVAGQVGFIAADEAFSQNSQYLYIRSFSDGRLVSFEVNTDGTLTPLESVAGIPPGAIGLASY
ncbi:MAG: lactonase family protein [Actinomycetota bacterium]|nr:lactonase family protein [Actinomycetota bacterium]